MDMWFSFENKTKSAFKIQALTTFQVTTNTNNEAKMIVEFYLYYYW
jgi:hypothetical protein